MATNKALKAIGEYYGVLRESNRHPPISHAAPSDSVPPRVDRFDQVHPRWRRATVVSLCVFLLGFGAEYVFWVAHGWTPSSPGLFDYKASAIADSLLLPALAALLVLAVDYLPSGAARERAWVSAASLIGFIAALAIQVSWLADANPQLNWTLPEPHHFNAPGYWHAGFFAIATSLFSGLFCLVGRRTRCNASAEDLVTVGWCSAVSLIAGTFLAFVVLDNSDTAGTTSSSSSLLGVGLAGFTIIVGGAWAFWHCGRRPLAHSIIAGLLGSAGFVAIVQWGLEGLGPAQAVASALAVTTTACALCAPGAARSSKPSQVLAKLAQFVIVGLLLMGTLSLGLELIVANPASATLAVVAGSVVAVFIGSSTSRLEWQGVLTCFAVTLTLGLFVLAGWLASNPSSTDAASTLGFAVFFLEALVIALIRERYEEVKIANATTTNQPETVAEAKYRKAIGDEAFVQALGYGLAALIGLLVLHVTAGSSLSVDEHAGSLVIQWIVVSLGGALAALLAAATYFLSRARRQLHRPLKNGERLHLDRSAAILGLCALGVWSVVVASQMRGAIHYPLAAGIGAAWLGAMTCEDIVRTGARVHLHSPGVSGYLFAAAAGTTIAISTMWLLSVGIWSGGAPGTMLSAAICAFSVPFVTGVVVAFASSPIAFGIRCNWLTPQSTVSNFLMTRMLYAALGFLALSIPFFAVGRVESLHPHNAALVVVTGLAMIPSFLGVFVWTLDNNRQHAEDETRRIPTDIKRFETPPPIRVADLVSARVAWLKAHVVFQYRTSVTLTIAGGIWLTIHLFI